MITQPLPLPTSPPSLPRVFLTAWELFRSAGVYLSRALQGSSLGGASSIDDASLVADVLGGDPRAFDAIVRRYQDRAYRFCLRYMGNPSQAEEVAQDVFLKVYRNLKSYRGESSFSTWFYQVMGNHCKNQVARSIRRKERLHVSLSPVPKGEEKGGGIEIIDSAPDPEGRSMEAERQRYLEAALATLEPDERAILIMREVEGAGYDEIGEALGLPLGTVKSRIFRARRALKVRVKALMEGGE